MNLKISREDRKFLQKLLNKGRTVMLNKGYTTKKGIRTDGYFAFCLIKDKKEIIRLGGNADGIE